MKRLVAGLISGAILATLLQGSAGADPFEAMVDHTQGSVKIVNPAGAPKHARFGLQVAQGARIVVGTGGSVTLMFYADGHREVMSGNGTVQHGHLAGSKVTVSTAATGNSPMRLANSPLDRLPMATVNRSIQTSPAPEVPIKILYPLLQRQARCTFIAAVRPTISWYPASTVKVQLYEGVPESGRLLWTRDVSGDHMAFPTQQPALKGGASYTLRMASRGASVDGVFEVCEPRAMPSVRRAEATFQSSLAQHPQDVSAYSTMASAYLDHKMAADAALVMQQLEARTPDDTLVHVWLYRYWDAIGFAAGAAREQAAIQGQPCPAP